MKALSSRLLLAPIAALVLAGFVITTAAEAAGARGGGGGGGARAGGGAQASAGGGRQNVQANNTKADARTNDVRSTSVNNVNVNKNVNVDVDVDHGVGGWDHPVAGAMVVGGAIAVTAAAVGSMVATVPATCVPVNYGGVVYQQCGATWYAPQGSQFVVVNPPY
jgi:hypothetical protein